MFKLLILFFLYQLNSVQNVYMRLNRHFNAVNMLTHQHIYSNEKKCTDRNGESSTSCSPIVLQYCMLNKIYTTILPNIDVGKPTCRPKCFCTHGDVFDSINSLNPRCISTHECFNNKNLTNMESLKDAEYLEMLSPHQNYERLKCRGKNELYHVCGNCPFICGENNEITLHHACKMNKICAYGCTCKYGYVYKSGECITYEQCFNGTSESAESTSVHTPSSSTLNTPESSSETTTESTLVNTPTSTSAYTSVNTTENFSGTTTKSISVNTSISISLNTPESSIGTTTESTSVNTLASTSVNTSEDNSINTTKNSPGTTTESTSVNTPESTSVSTPEINSINTPESSSGTTIGSTTVNTPENTSKN